MAKKNNMEVLISADSSKMTAAISNAKKALSEFSTNAEKLDAVQARFAKIENSAMPLQKKLKSLQQLMAEMNLNGLSNTDVFNDLAQQAGSYADAIGDARQAVRQFADDNMNLKATAEGLQFITGTASVLTGAMGMLGVQSDEVEQAMLKVQSAIALVNGVTSIANILNKDSALMLKLKSLKMTALTASEKANTVATTANTVSTTANATVTGASTIATTANTTSTVANSVATTANNTVRRIWNMTVAISKALLGDFTGLVILGAAALTTYALCTDNSTEATDKNNNAVRYSKKVVKEYSEELASTMKKNVERVKELSNQFNSLQSEASKTEWIKNNKSELDKLGVSVKDLINLDNEFKNVNSSVIASMENRAKTIVALNNVHKKYLEETATKSGELVGKFQLLKSQWDNLKSTAEKTEWLKNNQSEFNNLGLSVGDLTTAERIFVNDTAKVVKALEARAQAMAAQSAMTDAYSKFYKQKFDNANSVSGGGFYRKAKEGDKVDQNELIDLLKSVGSVDKNGGAKNDGSYKMQNGNFTLTEKGANALNEKRQMEARERRLKNDAQAEEQLAKTLDFYSKETEKATENIKGLGLDKVVNPTEKGKGSNSGSSSSGKSKTSKNEKIDYLVSVDDKTLDTAEKKLQAWQNKLKVTPTTDEKGIEKCKEEINKWKDEVEKRKLAIEIDDIEKGSIADLENQIKELEEAKKLLLKTKADPQSIKEVDDEIKRLKQDRENEEIRLGLKLFVEDGSLNEIKKRIKEKEEEIALALNTNIDPESMKKMQSDLDKLRKEEEAKEIEIGVKFNVPTIQKGNENWGQGSLEDKKQSMFNAQSNISDIQQNFRLGLIGKEEAIQQINEVNSKLQELGLKPIYIDFDTSSLDNADEKFKKTQDNISAISDITQKVGSTFSSIGSAVDGTAGDILSFAGTSISAIGQMIPQIVSLIGVKQAESMANGTASASALPFPANLAAIASIVATIAGVFASLPKFESGGIVGGSSFTGDKLLARVNSGEMILNKKQQQNLYDSMNDSVISNPKPVKVEVVGESTIKGSQLHTIFKNYDSKMSRIK